MELFSYLTYSNYGNGMQIATCYGCLSACYPHNYFYLYKWLIPFDFISFLSKNFIYFFFVFY